MFYRCNSGTQEERATLIAAGEDLFDELVRERRRRRRALAAFHLLLLATWNLHLQVHLQDADGGQKQFPAGNGILARRSHA
jgi:hypothetical protein